jgi:hypothetical protein
MEINPNGYVSKSGDTMTGALTVSPYVVTPIVISGASRLRLAVAAGATDGCGIVATTNVFLPVQAPTASAPAYVKGGIYFDTTLNKLRVGGATAWETITSV